LKTLEWNSSLRTGAAQAFGSGRTCFAGWITGVLVAATRSGKSGRFGDEKARSHVNDLLDAVGLTMDAVQAATLSLKLNDIERIGA